MLWIRFTLMRIWMLIRIRLITLMLMRIRILIFYLMQIRIRILFDADPEPDPTFHPLADPDTDPSFQIKAQTHEKKGSNRLISSISLWYRSGSWFLFDADPDDQNDADPDQQHWFKVFSKLIVQVSQYVPFTLICRLLILPEFFRRVVSRLAEEILSKWIVLLRLAGHEASLEWPDIGIAALLQGPWWLFSPCNILNAFLHLWLWSCDVCTAKIC